MSSKRRRRLLIILPSEMRGGAEQYALQIAQAAAGADWELHAAFPRREATASLVADLEALGSGGCYHPLEIPESDKPGAQSRHQIMVRLLRTLWLLLRLRPTACFLVLPTVQFMTGSILACGFLRVPTVVCFQYIHEFPFPGGLFPFSSRFLGMLAKARRTQRYIAISEYGRQRLARNFQMNPGPIQVVYNGVDHNLADVGEDVRLTCRNRIRAELELEDHHVMLLTVAALRRQKGHDILLPVIGSLVKTFPDTRWIWAGEGPERGRLEASCEQHGIRGFVRFLGERKDVRDLLFAADLFVFPTRSEGGQSYALVEAMLCNVPVVISDATGIPEVIKNSENGLLFPRENEEELHVALTEALEQPGRMKAMSCKARADAGYYSLENMCSQTLGVLDDVCH